MKVKITIVCATTAEFLFTWIISKVLLATITVMLIICEHFTIFDLLSVILIMWHQRGHHSSARRRNRKGQFLAGRPLLPPLLEGHASAMCPSTPSGGVHFWVLAFSIWGTPVSLTSRVTFSPRQVSRWLTSGQRLCVKMCCSSCLLTLLMVLPKEHRFGVKQVLMRNDSTNTDEAGQAVFYKVLLAF